MYVLHSKASQTFQNINLMNETTLKCMKIFTKSLKNLHFNERTSTAKINNKNNKQHKTERKKRTPNKSFNIAEAAAETYNIILKF